MSTEENSNKKQENTNDNEDMVHKIWDELSENMTWDNINSHVVSPMIKGACFSLGAHVVYKALQTYYPPKKCICSEYVENEIEDDVYS